MVFLARKQWPEKADFCIDRPNGTEFYTGVHFLNPVEFSENGATRRVPAGSFIVFAPGTPQYWVSRGCALRHDWFHAEGEIDRRMAKYGLIPDRLYCPLPDPAVTEAFGRLESNCFSEAPFREEYSDAVLDELFIAVARALIPQDAAVERELAERVRAARAAILAHPERRIAIARLAREAAVSESSFYAAYKALFGLSPARDRQAARIATAAGLLRQGRSVTDVAEAVGFGSEYTFIRAFRKATGTTPGQVKKQG